MLGLLRFAFVSDGLVDFSQYYLTPANLSGIIDSEPTVTGVGVSFRLKVRTIEINEDVRPLKGLVQVIAARSPAAVGAHLEPLRYGDLTTLRGTLQAPDPFDDFDYPAYLANQGVSSVLRFPALIEVEPGRIDLIRRTLSAWRLRLADGLKEAVPEPQSSMDRALLLGLRTDIPPEVTEAFRRTGTSHLLAISGLHVGVVMLFLMGAVRLLFGRRWHLYLLLPLLGIWLYAAMSGMAPPVWRAAVMGSIYLWGMYLGRSRSALPAIGAAAVLMLAVDPHLLKDVSFQLSFAAVLGLAALHQPIQDKLDQWLPTPESGPARLVRPMKASIAMSLAAVIATLPLVAFHFEQVSTLGIPATLVTLPAIPAILGASLLASVGQLIFPPFGTFFGWGAWLATTYIIMVIEFFARLPGASFGTGPLGWPLVVAYYSGLFGILRLYRFRQHRSSDEEVPRNTQVQRKPIGNGKARWLLVPLILGTVAIWTAVLNQPPALFKVTVLDVGQGDAIFIQSPEGHQMLVDGGPDPLSAIRAIGDRMPFWDRSLDAVVLTHPDADHLTGLIEVLLRYQVGTVLIGPQVKENFPDSLWQSAVAESGAALATVSAGQSFRLGQAGVQVLNPQDRPILGTGADVNNAGVVLRLSYGNIDFLLLGDLEEFGERYLGSQGLLIPSEVLKVGHHGSATSSTAKLLEMVAPSVAANSVGQDNRYGHPSPEVIERLSNTVGIDNVYTTSQQGDITVSTDGLRLWVETEG
ncbi:MAG: competence protein ComEC [Chloroflexi bacterium]|jgi:competence protein ComEC|nr:MAG: competence protein ComEC [Chloroflexota bacterium]